MTTEISEPNPEVWEEMVRLAAASDVNQLERFVTGLSVAEQAYALAHVDDEHTQRILGQLDPEVAAELIGNLSEVQAALAFGTLDPETAAAIFQELPSDEQADLLGDLEEQQANSILEELPRADAAAARELAAYPDDVAGGLMVSELLRFRKRRTVGEVIDALINEQDRFSDYGIRYGYVTDARERLVGVLPMQQLLFVKRSALVADVMIPNPLWVSDWTPLKELIEFFDAHHFLGVPVVGPNGRLLGVIHREAVEHAAALASESAYLKSQGIVGGEELRTMPVWLRARRRLSWLSVNIFLNLGAASVIATFEDTLEAVIALAVFLPIISDMSGCSGNQAVAVSMRELALGLVRPEDVRRVWLKEAAVGAINGAVLGLLIAGVALLYEGKPYLGLVVGVSLFVNTLIAVSIGGTVPLLLKRLNFDPAVASGPLLTTITDMCGFFLVLGLATLLLSKLTG